MHDKTYSLWQVHNHVPSEHTIDGQHMDGEAHFVHKEDGGDGLLVIGVFLEASDAKPASPLFAEAFNHFDVVQPDGAKTPVQVT